MPLSLLFRADANAEMGGGHVMRCLALGEACRRQGGQVYFVSAHLPDSLATRLADSGFNLSRHRANPASSEDADETREIVQELQPDWVVVDGYEFNDSFVGQLKLSPPRLLLLDDDGRVDGFEADAILNQNLHASTDDYTLSQPTTKLLLGTKYTLLRQEFLRRSSAIEIPTEARKILVTFGASDSHNVSQIVLEALAKVDADDLEVVVVAGATNRHLVSLEKWASRDNHQITLVKNSSDMVDLMRWADVAITAGGSTCWELAYCGVPVLVVITAENQAPIATELGQKGGQINLGWFSRCNAGSIATQLNGLLPDRQTRENMSKAGRRLVDGRGAERVLKELSNLSFKDDEVPLYGQQLDRVASS